MPIVSDPKTDRSTTPTTARFTYESVLLPGGCTARALTACRLITPCTPASEALPSAEEWCEPLSQLMEDAAGMPGAEVLKESRTDRVIRATLSFSRGPIKVVCKQSRSKGGLRAAIARLTGSRTRQNLRRGLRLLCAGVDTALPLAIVERTDGQRAAWLVTEAIPDAVDLDQVALTLLPRLSPSRAHAVKNGLIPPLVETLRRLESHKLRHRDLKASNLLITNWDGSAGEPRIWIVDVDGLRSPWRLSPRARRQPLVRLASSLLGYRTISRCDYVRFLRIYLTDYAGEPDGWKRWFRDIGSQADIYAHRAGK